MKQDCLKRILLFVTVLALAGTQTFSRGSDRSMNPRPISVRQSNAIVVNDAKFLAALEADWRFDKVLSKNVTLNLQLHITNLSKSDMVFWTFDTFGLTIKRFDGAEVKPTGGRDSTTITRPLSLPAGATYALPMRAELSLGSDAKTVRLLFYDGTGNVDVFGPLESGEFSLSFWYSTAAWSTPIHEELKKTIGKVPLWSGSIKTPSVPFEISIR